MLRTWIRRHPLASYFTLAWLLSWIVWSPLAAAGLGLVHVALPAWYHYVGSMGPLLAAVLVSAAEGGAPAARRLLGGLVAWRGRRGWIALGMFAPIAAFFVAAAILRLAGAPWPAFSQLGRTDEFPWMGPVSMWAFNTLTFGVGEETGWRGFALPRLQARHGALRATALLTIGWAGWHAPGFLYRPGYSSMGVGGAAGFLFSLFLGAIVLTWLYNSSRGSLLAVALFHGSIEIAYVSRASRDDVVAVISVLFMLWAAWAAWRGGPANLSHRPKVVWAPGAARTAARAP